MPWANLIGGTTATRFSKLLGGAEWVKVFDPIDVSNGAEIGEDIFEMEVFGNGSVHWDATYKLKEERLQVAIVDAAHASNEALQDVPITEEDTLDVMHL